MASPRGARLCRFARGRRLARRRAQHRVPLRRHRLARGRLAHCGPTPTSSLPRLASERPTGGRTSSLPLQGAGDCTRACLRGLPVAPPRRTRPVGRALSRLGFRAFGWLTQLHPRTAGLAEADRDCLLRRPRTVLAGPDVMHLLANELARLAGGALAPPLSLPRPLERLLLRHELPPRAFCLGSNEAAKPIPATSGDVGKDTGTRTAHRFPGLSVGNRRTAMDVSLRWDLVTEVLRSEWTDVGGWRMHARVPARAPCRPTRPLSA